MPRARPTAPAEAPYRIKDLCALTGVSREAVRFYIKEGLLPPAKKTAHNMGWYSDRHVELLGMIQTLQSERFLPLKAIRRLLQGGDEDLDFNEAQTRAFDDMRRKLASEHRDLKISDNPAQLAEELGLSRWEQKELRDLGVAASGSATISDVEITRQWIAIRDAGFTLARGFSPRDLLFLKDVVEIAVSSELRILSDRFTPLGEAEASRVIDVVIPALNRLFALLHERRVREFLDDVTTGATTPSRAAAAPAIRPQRNTRTRRRV